MEIRFSVVLVTVSYAMDIHSNVLTNPETRSFLLETYWKYEKVAAGLSLWEAHYEDAPSSYS
jgi:hypothetical protein